MMRDKWRVTKWVNIIWRTLIKRLNIMYNDYVYKYFKRNIHEGIYIL